MSLFQRILVPVDRMLMGSGAEQIIRLASAPVLVIRGTEPT